jgi:hypothetical protein
MNWVIDLVVGMYNWLVSAVDDFLEYIEQVIDFVELFPSLANDIFSSFSSI